MPLFSHNNNNNATNTTHPDAGRYLGHGDEVDPMYNNELGPVNSAGAAGGYQDLGMGMGTGAGHQNNAVPQGLPAQGNMVVGNNDPMYNESRGPTGTGNAGHGALRGGAEGAAVGGIAGHEGHHGHTGRDAALAGAGGAALAHEHNTHHHHHNNTNLDGTGAGGAGYDGGAAGTGMGTGYGGAAGAGSGRTPAVSSNQAAANPPTEADAKKLERSGKIDKVVGTLIGSTNMKERGYQKEAEGAAIREQSRELGSAQGLEAEAQMRRGNAVGMGAHPAHGTAPGSAQAIDSGVQPSYGTGQGAVTGTGVGGGAFGGLK